MTDELRLDATPIEIPVSIGDKPYVLCEADEATAVAYRNAQVRGASVDSKGQMIQLGSVGGIEPLLVSRCLLQLVLKDDGTEMKRLPVSEKVILKWPSRIVRPLFDKAKQISQLDEPVTLDGLYKQLAQIQERIAEMEAEEGPSKNGLTGDGGQTLLDAG